MQAAPALPAADTTPSRQRSSALPRFAWAVLVYNVAVILWGSLVRATGSGAGCGAHWPLCNGVVVQTGPRLATIIELTHRVTSGVTVLTVVGLAVWVWVATPPRHLARITAVAAALLTFNEALIGALLVLLQLTADNRSPARAMYLSLHLANTLLLLAALALTAHFLSRSGTVLRNRIRFYHLPLAAIGLAATLLVGVTGSLAALGDTLFPAGSLRAALAQDVSSASSWLLRLRLVHPLTGLLAGAFVCWLLARSVFASNGAAQERSVTRKLALAVLLLFALQYGLGFLDVALLAPVWLQLVHLLGADVLWIALVVLAARVCVREPAA